VSAKKQIDWVILEGEGLFCRRCGAREKLFPSSLSRERMAVIKAIERAFSAEHGRCKVTETSPITLQARSPADWLRGGDVGLSSITICSVLANVGPTVNHTWPRDPSDFGRCHRFLKLFPGLRARLGEVAAAYPDTPWVAYVREWDRMTALYEEELPSGSAPRLYLLMKELRGEA
jgi:hypothetical protein